MIARTWRGVAPAATADAYEKHFTSKVVSHLEGIAGYRGASLLRREADGEVTFLAITLWDSLAAIQAFSGPDPEVAIVAPDARAVLTAFDDFARHYEVAYRTERTA